MDNLTHTLVGLLIGATAIELTRAVKGALPENERRTVVIAAAAIGSNLPDTDLLYSIAAPGKLGYLLEHRGYTHTVVAAIVGAVLLWLTCEGWWHWRGRSLDRTDRALLAGVALFTPLLHIAMDFTNTYGVHPFWPLDNHWYYGDAVFIAEPLLWVAMTPLYFAMRTRAARGVLGGLLLLGVLLGGATGRLAWIAVVTLLSMMALFWIIARKLAIRTALFAGIALWWTITLIFAFSSSAARRELTEIFSKSVSGEQLLDIALTPAPGNPACWEAIVMTTSANEYVLRRASFSLAPQWIAATTCRTPSLDAPTTATLQPVPLISDAKIAWRGQFAMPRMQFATIVQDHCDAAAVLRFARAPFFAVETDGTIAGDLRYDRERSLGFAEFHLGGPETPCSMHLPPWNPPRADLLAH